MNHNLKDWVKCILNLRNNELWLKKTKRSVAYESILNEMGLDINKIPSRKMEDKEIQEFIDYTFQQNSIKNGGNKSVN